MYIILCILGLFILLTALYLFLIMPRLKKPPIGSAPLTTCHFAHRGYFNLQEGIPENTLLAFARAAAAGYGAELDVHLTKDHKLAVIHDSHLQNLCGCDSIIEEMNWQEVRSLRIQNSPYGIPTLREVLDAVKGTVPLLIEIKGKNVEPLMPLVMKELEA